MSKISVVINTLNEEENLPRAMKSVKSFADEIVVVDMESIDKTRGIAKKHGAKVFSHKRMGYVEPARNFAISKSTGDWIFILDADEEIPSSLASKLKKLIKDSKVDYYGIPRKNLIFGKWMKHSRWWPDYNIRFFKKGAVTWENEIHSIPITMGTGDDLFAKEKYAIIHHHYQSIEQFVERMNTYTSVQAKEKKNDGYKFDWKDLIGKPVSEFNSRYFAGFGYKDGVHGLGVAGLQAFSELVLYLKLWSHSTEASRDKQLSVTEISREIKELRRRLVFGD